MMPMPEAWHSEFQWIRVSRFERRFVLRDAAGTARAHLDFDALFGSRAAAHAGEREWTLTTDGWLRPRVCAHAARNGTPEGNMAMRWLGWAGRGTLTSTDGRQLAWGPTSLLHDRRWAFTDRSGQEALVYEKPLLRQNGNNDLLCARLTINPSFETDRAVDLLAVLAMYLQG